MKKLAFVVIAIFMMAMGSQAQHIFNQGDLAFNAGIGVLGGDGFIPSVEVSGEYGVIPTGDIGLVSFGGVIGYKYSTYSYSWYHNIDYDYNYSEFIFGGRASWHLHTFDSDKWDAYAGFGLGGRVYTTWEWDYHKNDVVDKGKLGFYQEFFVGGRMMFSPAFGLFAEVGYSPISTARFGVTFFL